MICPLPDHCVRTDTHSTPQRVYLEVFYFTGQIVLNTIFMRAFWSCQTFKLVLCRRQGGYTSLPQTWDTSVIQTFLHQCSCVTERAMLRVGKGLWCHEVSSRIHLLSFLNMKYSHVLYYWREGGDEDDCDCFHSLQCQKSHRPIVINHLIWLIFCIICDKSDRSQVLIEAPWHQRKTLFIWCKKRKRSE